MNTSQLRQWLAAGKTERVLEELLRETVDVDSDLHHEATLLSARFENITRQKRLGTVEFEDEARELAQINHATLDIINQLDKTVRPGGIPSWAKSATVVLVALGLIGGVGYAAGWFEKNTDPVETNTEQTAARDTPAVQMQQPAKTESAPPRQETEPVREPSPIKTKPQTTAGTTAAQRKATRSVPQATIPPKQPATEPVNAEPENARTEESGLRTLLPEGEALAVNCKTNKGRVNIHYRAGEAVRFYFLANQPCYVRAIYQIADKRLVLLADNRQLSATQEDQWIELGRGVEAADPFGEQRVYVFAQTTPFPPLTTRTASDGTIFITENLNEALNITRKLRRRQTFAEQDVMLKTHP